MNRTDLINFCLTFPATYEDYPFEKQKNTEIWTVMRHKANKKSFAFINVLHDRLCVNLKCEPNEADFLRKMYKDVIPGFHMNKTHWNTVFINGDVPVEEIKRQIASSYDLIKPKIKV